LTAPDFSSSPLPLHTARRWERLIERATRAAFASQLDLARALLAAASRLECRYGRALPGKPTVADLIAESSGLDGEREPTGPDFFGSGAHE
jgi:hypothetical protein